ncbi:hypothetical protein GS531_25070 [Rhodococcus hoagii]|nr:hypothetical protein [Prescottella equi]
MGQHTGHYHRFAARLATPRHRDVGPRPGRARAVRGDPGAPGLLADLADDAARLTESAVADRPGLPLVVMGHSLGAAVAVTLLRRGRAPFRARRAVRNTQVGCAAPRDVGFRGSGVPGARGARHRRPAGPDRRRPSVGGGGARTRTA